MDDKKLADANIADAVGHTRKRGAYRKPTPDTVFRRLERIYYAGMKKIEIRTPRGDETGETKRADLTNALRATEDMGKLLGMFVDRSQVELSGDVKQVLDGLIKAVADEVDDPEMMARIVERLTGQDGGPDSR